MSAIKKDTIKGNLNGNKSTYNVELVELSRGYEVNYKDTNSWGIGYKKYRKCDSISEASVAYSELIQLIQI